MNTFETIMSRKSVRKFTDEAISDSDLNAMLEAAMAGPSAANARPFEFLVVRDKEMLAQMAEKTSKYSGPLKNAALGIVVLVNKNRMFPDAPGYAAVDTSIATENMILAAWSMGIGSVWLGVWPSQSNIDALTELLNLPADIEPQHLIAFGYPEDPMPNAREGRFEENRIHYEKW